MKDIRVEFQISYIKTFVNAKNMKLSQKTLFSHRRRRSAEERHRPSSGLRLTLFAQCVIAIHSHALYDLEMTEDLLDERLDDEVHTPQIHKG